MAQLSFSTKYQRWNNVDERDDQRCFNVDSTLMCLLGNEEYFVGVKISCFNPPPDIPKLLSLHGNPIRPDGFFFNS